MFFIIAVLIIAVACSAITIKTLVGYAAIRLAYKIAISAIILLGWFSLPIVGLLRKADLLNQTAYMLVSNGLYYLLGFVFILFIILMMRDVVWYGIFGLAKLLKIDGWHINPSNISLLGKANLIVVVLSVLATAYAIFEGNKAPKVVEEFIYTTKINRNVRIVQISDLHITRATPVAKVKQIVAQVNMLNPDVIVLTGDTLDDAPAFIVDQLAPLKELSAPFGVYSVMGNHEFYNDVYAAKRTLDSLGLKFLFNGGFRINKTNVYVAGIPDMNTMVERVNLWRALNKSENNDYRVLLSHAPIIVDSLSKKNVDLILAGHTHGGQIFPFHLLVKQANKYLAGKYKTNDIDLLVSRGAGSWGPQMRLFAPTDIVVINLLKS